MLYKYPPQTEFNKVVPKSKIYDRGKPSSSLKEKFVSEISQIIWKYKLSPETINLPAREEVREIQIFFIVAKTNELTEDLLRCIDRSIPSPIIFEVQYEDKIKVVAAYKRQNEADSARWVVDLYFSSEWIFDGSERASLPVALNMGSLYESILRSLINIPQRQSESLRELVERAGVIRSKQDEHRRLERRLEAEQQFNRKVELNSKLREVGEELKSLSRGDN